MNAIRRGAVLWLVLLSATVATAIGAASATAIGTTAYTCASTGVAEFSDGHCLNGQFGGVGSRHIAIAEETSFTGTNSGTATFTSAAAPARLKGTLAGVATEIECTSVSASGSFRNSEGGGEMVISGSGIEIHYTGCAVKKPAEKGCQIPAGTIKTGVLKARTQGLTGLIEIYPQLGTELVSITIEKCSVAALNNIFPVTGVVKATPSGATLTTTHEGVTAANTMKFGGNKAGLETSVTLKSFASGTALSVT